MRCALVRRDPLPNVQKPHVRLLTAQTLRAMSCPFTVHIVIQVQRPAEEPKLRADVANLKAFALRFREVLPADYYPVSSCFPCAFALLSTKYYFTRVAH